MAYWVTTAWVALGMVSGGVAQVLHVLANVDGFVLVGHPLHFASRSASRTLSPKAVT